MNSTVNREQLRDALKLLVDIVQLSRHPLSHSSLILTRIETQQYLDLYTPSLNGDLRRGQALYDLLNEAIQALRPAAGQETFENKHWRHYLILNNQYVRGMRPAQLSELWHIGRSTYAHELSRAIDRLGELITAWEEEQSLLALLTPPTQPPTADGEQAADGMNDVAHATQPFLPATSAHVPVKTLPYTLTLNGHSLNGDGLQARMVADEVERLKKAGR